MPTSMNAFAPQVAATPPASYHAGIGHLVAAARKRMLDGTSAPGVAWLSNAPGPAIKIEKPVDTTEQQFRFHTAVRQQAHQAASRASVIAAPVWVLPTHYDTLQKREDAIATHHTFACIPDIIQAFAVSVEITDGKNDGQWLGQAMIEQTAYGSTFGALQWCNVNQATLCVPMVLRAHNASQWQVAYYTQVARSALLGRGIDPDDASGLWSGKRFMELIASQLRNYPVEWFEVATLSDRIDALVLSSTGIGPGQANTRATPQQGVADEAGPRSGQDE